MLQVLFTTTNTIQLCRPIILLFLKDPLQDCYDECTKEGYTSCLEKTDMSTGENQMFSCKHACVMRSDGEPVGDCKSKLSFSKYYYYNWKLITCLPLLYLPLPST